MRSMNVQRATPSGAGPHWKNGNADMRKPIRKISAPRRTIWRTSSPSVSPFARRTVVERWIDRAPAPGVVHEQHPGHGHPAEDVEREEPLAPRGDRRRRLDGGRLDQLLLE